MPAPSRRCTSPISSRRDSWSARHGAALPPSALTSISALHGRQHTEGCLSSAVLGHQFGLMVLGFRFRITLDRSKAFGRHSEAMVSHPENQTPNTNNQIPTKHPSHPKARGACSVRLFSSASIVHLLLSLADFLTDPTFNLVFLTFGTLARVSAKRTCSLFGLALRLIRHPFCLVLMGVAHNLPLLII